MWSQYTGAQREIFSVFVMMCEANSDVERSLQLSELRFCQDSLQLWRNAVTIPRVKNETRSTQVTTMEVDASLRFYKYDRLFRAQE